MVTMYQYNSHDNVSRSARSRSFFFAIPISCVRVRDRVTGFRLVLIWFYPAFHDSPSVPPRNSLHLLATPAHDELCVHTGVSYAPLLYNGIMV